MRANRTMQTLLIIPLAIACGCQGDSEDPEYMSTGASAAGTDDEGGSTPSTTEDPTGAEEESSGGSESSDSGDSDPTGADATAGEEESTGAADDTGTTGGEAEPGGECNHLDDWVCQAGNWCKYDDGECGGGQNGSCVESPQICTLEFNPVCACNGVTYDNPCNAEAAGWDIEHLGPC